MLLCKKTSCLIEISIRRKKLQYVWEGVKQLTIPTGKDWCFTQFSTGMAGWLLLIFFISLHNQLSSIHSIISTDV